MTSRRNGWSFGLVFAASVLGSVAAEPSNTREAENARAVIRGRDAEPQKESASGRAEPGARKPIESAPRPDPFEPFLRDWVSPRHRIQQPVVSGTTGLPPPRAQSSAPERSMVAPNAAPGSGALAAKENPYLKAMSPSPPEAVKAVQSQPPEPPRLESRNAGEEGRAAQVTLTSPEAPVRAPSTGYRPPPAKDAKYFPQQKRF